MKICADCKHCLRRETQTACASWTTGSVPESFTCKHNECRMPVSGKPLDCFTARTSGDCGPDAKYWEPRNE